MHRALNFSNSLTVSRRGDRSSWLTDRVANFYLASLTQLIGVNAITAQSSQLLIVRWNYSDLKTVGPILTVEKEDDI